MTETERLKCHAIDINGLNPCDRNRIEEIGFNAWLDEVSAPKMAGIQIARHRVSRLCLKGKGLMSSDIKSDTISISALFHGDDVIPTCVGPRRSISPSAGRAVQLLATYLSRFEANAILADQVDIAILAPSQSHHRRRKLGKVRIFLGVGLTISVWPKAPAQGEFDSEDVGIEDRIVWFDISDYVGRRSPRLLLPDMLVMFAV